MLLVMTKKKERFPSSPHCMTLLIVSERQARLQEHTFFDDALTSIPSFDDLIIIKKKIHWQQLTNCSNNKFAVNFSIKSALSNHYHFFILSLNNDKKTK